MGQKSADLDIHEGAVYSEPESSSHRHKSKTYGRMFAFDAEGQYLLTGGPQSGVIYKVQCKGSFTPAYDASTSISHI